MRRIAFIAILTLSMLIVTTLETRAQEAGTWQSVAPSSQSVNVLLTTPYAVYAGQYATQSWYGAYNGLYQSKNLGRTWAMSGLTDRGVTDLAYSEGVIYAATYYETQGEVGLFSSSNEGLTWQHLGPNYAGLKVALTDNTVIVGTKYNGIWTSRNNGADFTQTLTVTGTDKDITGLECSGTFCLAGTYVKTYKSLDGGSLWQEIPPLTGKAAGSFAVYNKVVLAGTRYGLYRSTDAGDNWNLYGPWATSQVGNVILYNKRAYATKKESNGSYQVYESNDFGLSWESTHLNSPANTQPLTGLTWLYTKPAYLFAAGFGNGIQRYAIKADELKTLAFLGPLWKDSSPTEQLQSITSYFDHSYPLLGYYLHSEPEAEKVTTLNFLGEKEAPPQLYYSSHDGYDFGLLYGTKLLAPASGLATYQYSPLGGNTVKIDHQNGYQTTYMHLQKNGLFTLSAEPVWVDKGDVVGLVGLTGNTTGPHLHFAVTQDKGQDGAFSNDYPDGKTDPYSWQDETADDPWETYTWSDSLGEHSGNASPLLWASLPSPTYCYVSPSDALALEQNPISLEAEEGSFPAPATIEIIPRTSTNTAFLENNLKALMHTSFKLTALDQLKQGLSDFTKPIKIIYDLSNAALNGIDPATLRIAFFNPAILLWESLSSTWNPIDQKLEALTDHFSEFVVVGQKTDPNPPETNIAITGQKDGIWYTESPTITLSANDGEGGSGIEKSFYSTDGGNSWEEYVTQTQVVKEGVYAVLFKSSDKAENYEPAKDSPLLRVDTSGLFKDEIALNGSLFTIATE